MRGGCKQSHFLLSFLLRFDAYANPTTSPALWVDEKNKGGTPMQEHFQDIYQNHAATYDRLVSCEDRDNNVLKTLESICSLEGLEVVEWGAGTGRITRMLLPFAKQINAFDASPQMLEIARKKLQKLDAKHVHLGTSQHHRLPLEDESADLAIEGWSFSHLAEELPHEEGAAAVQKAIDEMHRIVRPTGTLILMETMGTGQTEPSAPEPFQEKLYAYFATQGFQMTWCRTDYAFASLEEAEHLLSFFFGEEMIDLLDKDTLTLPECTGFWYLHKG